VHPAAAHLQERFQERFPGGGLPGLDGGAGRLAAPANAAQRLGELGIFLRHRLVGLLLCGLSSLVGFLPGGSRSFLALVARLALGPRLDETALLGRGSCGRRGGNHDGE
jgi:hypothetical protein